MDTRLRRPHLPRVRLEQGLRGAQLLLLHDSLPQDVCRRHRVRDGRAPLQTPAAPPSALAHRAAVNAPAAVVLILVLFVADLLFGGESLCREAGVMRASTRRGERATKSAPALATSRASISASRTTSTRCRASSTCFTNLLWRRHRRVTLGTALWSLETRRGRLSPSPETIAPAGPSCPSAARLGSAEASQGQATSEPSGGKSRMLRGLREVRGRFTSCRCSFSSKKAASSSCTEKAQQNQAASVQERMGTIPAPAALRVGSVESQGPVLSLSLSLLLLLLSLSLPPPSLPPSLSCSLSLSLSPSLCLCLCLSLCLSLSLPISLLPPVSTNLVFRGRKPVRPLAWAGC